MLMWGTFGPQIQSDTQNLEYQEERAFPLSRADKPSGFQKYPKTLNGDKYVY